MERISYDVFPYDDGSEDVLTMLLEHKEFSINNIYVPRSWRTTFHEVSVFKSLKFIIGVPSAEKINNLIIIPSKSDINDQLIDTLIYSAISQGRRVINLRNKKYSLPYDNTANFINGLNDVCSFNSPHSSTTYSNAIKLLSVPIIGVGSVIENCGELLLQYRLKNKLELQGYKVLWIGSSNISEFFGAYGNLSNLSLNCTSFATLVADINRAINNALVATNCNVVLLGIPYGVIALNNCIVNDYGIMFYLLSNALNIDYMITLLPNDSKLENTDIQELNSLMYYRFGIKNAYWWITDKEPYYYYIDTTQKFILNKCLEDSTKNVDICDFVYKYSEKNPLDRFLNVIENKPNT